MKKKNIFLIALFVVGFLIRVYKVGSYPPLLWDEAALGYNAYSVLTTARDEHGQVLPLIFKSFGDFKPGLYVYLCLPFVFLFGLNPLAVRLPSVLLGALSPIILFFLVKEISKSDKKAFWSAFALVFLPWHIHFSRGAWEANCLVAFILLGSWLFVDSLKKKSVFLIKIFLSGLFFFLGLFIYQGGKLAAPLAILALLAVNFHRFWALVVKSFAKSNRKPVQIVFASLILLTLSLTAFWYIKSFSGSASNRLKVMSLLSYNQPEEELLQISAEDGSSPEGLHFQLFHGKWLHFGRGFLTRYFNHLSPRFLAFEGDWSNSRQSAPYFGVVGYFGFAFLIIGLIVFLSKKRKSFENVFLIWLLVFPLPAALTRDIITGVRSLNLVIPVAVFTGFGLDWLFSLKIALFFKKVFIVFAGLSFVFSMVYYFDLYYFHMVKISPKQWLYGHEQVMTYINDVRSNYDQIFMSKFYGQPYIYYLFYSQYSPKKYQELNTYQEQGHDVGQVEKLIDNKTTIYFNADYWQALDSPGKSLVVFSEDELTRFELQQNKPIFGDKVPLGVIGDKALFYAYEIY